MGFRNPLTSLSADQITPGLLDPGVIAQAVRSAQSGGRIELDEQDLTGSLRFYAGIAAETPSSITAVTSTGVAGDQTLSIVGGTNPATLPPAGSPEIDLYAAQAPDASWRGQIAIHGDDVWLGRPSASSLLTRKTTRASGSGSTSGTDTVVPGCTFDVGTGVWIVIGAGYADWAVGSGSPRYFFRLTAAGVEMTQVQVYQGTLVGSVPFMLIGSIAGPTTLALSAQSTSWTGGQANAARCRLFAIPVHGVTP